MENDTACPQVAKNDTPLLGGLLLLESPIPTKWRERFWLLTMSSGWLVIYHHEACER